jgi:4-aminobutyrate aminotransferase-like enzyme
MYNFFLPVKVKPPLCFTTRMADQFVDALDQALREIYI